IAEALGASPTAIRMRISRAREQLREEMIAIMGTAFNQQRLQAKFTFNIVEVIKRIKINPISQTPKGLPWGLSLATGLLIAVLSINPALISFVHVGTPIFAPLPNETKVLKVGEIPVDVVKTSNISIISNLIAKGKDGELKPDMQNAFFMAPQGEGGAWAKQKDTPTARMDTSSAVVGGKIYVIGGSAFNNGPSLSIVEEYNPATDTWTKKADMPTKRIASSSSAVNGMIYTIGGATNDINVTGLPTVEEYDPVTDKWTKKADMPTPRWGLSTSAVNGKIYAIGGCLRYPFPSPGVPTAAVEEYNPETDTWTKKTDMPTTPRWYCSSSVVNGKIYVIGGTSNDQNNKLSIVEEYDPGTDTWTRKADMPTARWALTAGASGGRIYAIGGPLQAVGTKTVEEYNPETDTWKKVADMPTGRYTLTASEVNGKIYVIGGVIGIPNFNWNDPAWKGLPTIEEYTPDGWQSGQSVSPQGKLPITWGETKK
ncbi:MAG: kelch repeat-containing protein, partial [Candidatus Poribacteria bacterium]